MRTDRHMVTLSLGGASLTRGGWFAIHHGTIRFYLSGLWPTHPGRVTFLVTLRQWNQAAEAYRFR